MAYKPKPPNNQEGKNGDIVIALDKGVNKLYGKANGQWLSFGNGKKITINDKEVFAQRLSYAGELGWELYVSMSQAKEIYNTIVKTGKEFEISHCGTLSMDTMRMETGYLHWGHDISPEENQYQAGLQFAISYKKNIDFIGKESLLKIKNKKDTKKFAMLTLNDSKPGEPLLLHDEPIYKDNKIIGRTTSGNFSFNFNKNLAFGYINSELSNEDLKKENLFIEVEKIKHPATIITKPLNNKNIRNL